MKIKFFGVGAALQQNMDNTYFLIEDGDNKLQVDCGGGLGLAQSVKRGEINFENLFITHCHTDHFLGFFHLFRTIGNEIPKLNIYCSKFVEKNIREISRLIMSKAKNKMLDDGTINFFNNDDFKKQNVGEFEIEPLNLNSKKMIQYGFLFKYKGKKILFFGDEAIGVLDRDDLDKFKGVDYLICESLNINSKDTKNGGDINLEKMSHISAKHAGKIAKTLQAKNLVLVHSHEFENREELLKDDAKKEFNGNIIVPREGDVLEF